MVIVASGTKFDKEGLLFQLHPMLPKNYKLATICNSSAMSLYAVGLLRILSQPRCSVLVFVYVLVFGLDECPEFWCGGEWEHI